MLDSIFAKYLMLITNYYFISIPIGIFTDVQQSFGEVSLLA